MKVIAIGMSFVGVVIVATKGNLNHLNFSLGGVLLALLGAIVYGIFSVLGKKHHHEKFTSTMFYYLFSFLYSTIAVLFFSKIPTLSSTQFAGLLWLGIFPSGLAFTFWLLALKHGDTAKMSNLIFMTPFISLVYIYFLLGEKILLSSVIGLIIIVAGILMQSLYKNKTLLESKK